MQSEAFRGIIERLRQGDEKAFEELYTRLSGRVFSYILPRVKSRDEALDVLQEVFIAIWSARLRFAYRNDASVYGFVFTIARRTLASYYGGKKRDAATLELPQEDRYDMDIDGLGDAHMIERAMADLSDDDRDVLTLRYWSGFSFDEIAQMQGKHETAMRVRHHRALARLKSILSTYGA
jgi:RNA polymerase sigma-70 factor (ECF subfamily)